MRNDLIRLHHGDCLSVMPTLGVRVDSVITDPPYGLSFMGKAWDHGVPGVPFWQAALECTKPGGMLMAFGGTRTFHRLACAIEDAGWEIRDCIMWVYGSGFPKSLDISKAIDKAAGAERELGPKRVSADGTVAHDSAGKRNEGYERPWRDDAQAVDRNTRISYPATDESAREWSGYGTALKPAWEPIIVAMKPLDGTFAENAQRHGVAGLAIDSCRIETEHKLPRFSKANESIYGGNSLLKSETTQTTSRDGNPDGRFPANLIHDGSDEVLAGFPVSDHAPGTRSKRTFSGWKNDGDLQKDQCVINDTGSTARFFYCAKASRSERGKTNTHPTVKPLSLMRYLCRLTKTPTGGIVLDPFSGSGSTLIAAALEGREAIGIEQDEGNCRIAKERFAEQFDKGPHGYPVDYGWDL